jgi:hypothetical protein
MRSYTKLSVLVLLGVAVAHGNKSASKRHGAFLAEEKAEGVDVDI